MRAVETKIDNTSPSSTGRLPAEEFNSLQTEAEEAVRTAGITLDTSEDTDLQMLAQAIARYASKGTFGIDLGAANAYVVVAADDKVVPPKALFLGMRVRFWPRADNSTASTLNAFGLGIKKLLDQDGAALSSGAVKAGRMTEADYDPSLDSGAGGWKLSPASNNLIVSGGGTSTITTPGTVGGAVLRPCLTGITGDITNLASCGNAISSSEYTSAYLDDYAFDGSTGTRWQPTPALVATDQWIGWDFDPGVAGYYGTITGAKFQQYHNATNRTDIWDVVALEASQDLVTWVPIGVFTSCTHPGDDALGPLESITISAYSARAFRLRPTSVTRFTSAALLVQVANIADMQLTKS